MFKSALCLTLLAVLCWTAQAKQPSQLTSRKAPKASAVPADLDLTAEMPTNLPPVAPVTNQNIRATIKALTNVVAAIITITNVPPVAPEPPGLQLPTEEWVALDRWARDNRLGTLTNFSLPGAPTFGLQTPAGEFVVRTGSVLALWGGLELRLGFVPQLIGGEPFLHRLDIEKNLVPLLAKVGTPAPGPRVIVLDPGHGGNDSGTRNAQGDQEKEYTLDWAFRLEALLTQAGWKVVLTRTNDVQVSLTERVAIADRHRADLFLSLHFNATAQPYHAGIETYCVTPAGMPSNVTRGYEDNAALVFPNNQFDAQNLQLALNLHRSLLTTTGGRDRGVRRARFMTVLRGQNRPAVLMEGGYLSNPDEAVLITSTEYRQKLAEAIASALNARMENGGPPVSHCERIHDANYK